MICGAVKVRVSVVLGIVHVKSGGEFYFISFSDEPSQMSQSIPLHNRKQLTSAHSNSNLSHHSDIEDSILEERLRIANFVLPEDNLEDLLRLPIAPELISRKLRQQQQQKQLQHQEQQKQLLLSITPPSTSPPSPTPPLLPLEQHHEKPPASELPQQPKPTKIQKPRINTSNNHEQHHSQPPSSSTSTLHNRLPSKPSTPVNKINPLTKDPRQQRSLSTQTATQSKRARSKSAINNLSVPSSSRKTTQARTVLGENNHTHNHHNNHASTKEKTPSTTSTAQRRRRRRRRRRNSIFLHYPPLV
ncbi:hypothetical protein VP01_2802g1 [Puccinia sorghi]|uniref:Uncharacterized protein n=1 Tax=Puccinia sorghi TaxID=27349 RepID=A0A0L6V386_9BASI|nr:hypothetical protein VP01_2802g1 [Puccinia sorghi]